MQESINPPVLSTSSSNINTITVESDEQPPSYLSIYPFAIDLSSNKANSNRENNTNESVNARSNYFLFQGTNSHNNQSYDLFQYAPQEPLSYEELFRGVNNSTGTLGSNTASTRFLYQNSINGGGCANPLLKQLQIQFTKPFLFRHSILVLVVSFLLIVFQVILMSNQALLSYLASGLWAGFVNIVTLAISLLASIIFV
jgi:hypothetical protein